MRTLTIISAILFIGLFSGLSLAAGEVWIRDDAPDHYQVIPGDTLWGIASRFLREPWRWPEIWQMNREQIRNPHRIYPGDVIVIENTPYGKRLKLAGGKGAVRLSPRIRTEASAMQAIPGIPAEKIAPFLDQPLVVEKNQLDKAPVILGASDDRVILSTGNKVYVNNLPADQGRDWQVFRSGKVLIDPDHANRILGYEAVYLGTVEVTDFAVISTAKITRSVQEILKGDRLLPLSAAKIEDYLPHAPDFPVTARIISVYGGVHEIGENMIVALNQGKNDGIEPGHILAVYHEHSIRSHEGKSISLPDERIGLAMVFRVFDTVSYALIMQSTQTIKVMDELKTP
ncbi:LysM peptidoglycan-binding domain-containing protein [Nitrosomonas sp.]|uniref:LysM peptidoglycan-binding domain-containing protein n=1 Tax=Nitrosomonas sp. TaxID=42353 RepID=UPI0025EF3C18|nr:LysM peptidoglycan-binding domain-containing protein [Nitrosomonas sp.]MCC6916413.1 LysM peptidoglycan-binding domain-containing protein [Nitrosomonas sp.]